LVSNEVVPSRALILKENIIKWGAPNVMVTRSNPTDFSALSGFFDVMVVDAPCSGEGMFLKGYFARR
jgi:16S rRNA C967 or C1407 C5-methylase (RsmB/RsmF family)